MISKITLVAVFVALFILYACNLRDEKSGMEPDQPIIDTAPVPKGCHHDSLGRLNCPDLKPPRIRE